MTTDSKDWMTLMHGQLLTGTDAQDVRDIVAHMMTPGAVDLGCTLTLNPLYEGSPVVLNLKAGRIDLEFSIFGWTPLATFSAAYLCNIFHEIDHAGYTCDKVGRALQHLQDVKTLILRDGAVRRELSKDMRDELDSISERARPLVDAISNLSNLHGPIPPDARIYMRDLTPEPSPEAQG